MTRSNAELSYLRVVARLEVFTVENATRVVVTLSRRNLLALLHKLDMPLSLRTLASYDSHVDGAPASDLLLVVQCEDDDEHYGRRLARPGPMHQETEDFVADQGGWTAPPQG
jgi:hypothetical protein